MRLTDDGSLAGVRLRRPSRLFVGTDVAGDPLPIGPRGPG